MSTMKGIMRRAILSGLVVAAFAAGSARADVASDKSGAILIFPKIIVDGSGVFAPPTDTELQITNTSNSVIAARCFLVDTTPFCNNDPDTSCTVEGEADPRLYPGGTKRCPAGGLCVPRWQKSPDFRMTLTKRQPISWGASHGLLSFPLNPQNPPPTPAFGPGGQSNGNSSIAPVPRDPFFGELRCVQVDPSSFQPSTGLNPANNGSGDLIGAATIVETTPGESSDSRVDARKYNAIGIQANADVGNDGNDTLTLGTNQEYNGCPNALILNHFFDDATVTTHLGAASASVKTNLTVIPCGADYELNTLRPITLQFLVYNEFEQRFSSSTSFSCWREVQLSDLDTRPGNVNDNNDFSIFNVNVQGTLSGQTRIRPVAGNGIGNTVLGIAEEFWTQSSGGTGPGNTSSTAGNLHFVGTRPGLNDTIILSTDEAPN